MARPGRKRSNGERYECGKPRPQFTPDHGTPEQQRILEITFEVTEDAGIERARATECLLDRLLNEGALGEGDIGVVRHSAGIWLRTLHERAFGQNVTGAYSPNIKSSGVRFPDPYRVGLGRLIREGVAHWDVLRSVVIDEDMPKSLEGLNESLDWLESYRG